MRQPQMAPKGILTAAQLRELLKGAGDANKGSFDLKAIRKRMAFGAQDDRI